MVTIQIRNGMLDVGDEQEIQMETTKLRFSEGLRDQYTNDIDIPKTKNNIKILECYNLLDSPNQLYGNQIQPAILTVDGYMRNCYLQVVSITDTKISICLYEKILPNELRDKKIKDILKDDYNSIYVWSVNNVTAYPSNFKRYQYGNSYNSKYAQYHPVMFVNSVINRLQNETGYSLPQTDSDLLMLAQKKYVCPENKIQVISATLSANGGQDMVLVGGQHITNDMEGWNGRTSMQTSDITSFTYNRDCTAKFKVRMSWGRKLTTTTNTYMVSMFRNGVFETGWNIIIDPYAKRNGYYESPLYDITFHKDDTIYFHFASPTTSNPENKFDLVQLIMDIEYVDYEITEDDYGEELEYCYRHPTLMSWGPDDVIWQHHFDASTTTFSIYNFDGSLNQNASFDLTLPWRGYSYFGYFCNLSDITVGELFYSLCLYNGMDITHTDDGGLMFVGAEKTKEIEGEVTEIYPTSEHLGKENFILWAGQDTDHTTPITEIDSIWLEPNNVLLQSQFAVVTRGLLGRARVDQYEFEYDTNKNGDMSIDVSFNDDIDGQVVLRLQTHENSNSHFNLETIPPHPMSTMGFDKITSSTQVQIETYTDEVSNKDYVYLDGRKFMVVSSTLDLITKKSVITALLVPTT